LAADETNEMSDCAFLRKQRADYMTFRERRVFGLFQQLARTGMKMIFLAAEFTP
jgi:hypothetical protein